MPFYTFVCNSCGHKFEIMCSMKELENGSISCPDCGANELDRHFEGFSVTVKGANAADACPSGKSGCPMAGKCACPHQH